MAVSNNVRSVIELFCKILGDHGISDVRAETLRQGKFNRDIITNLTWKLLYDVVCFLDSDSTSSLHIPTADQVLLVKQRLQNWGYLSKSFAEIPTDLAFGSRDVLLALGWVIHTQHLFREIICRKTNPFHQDIRSFAQKTRIAGRLHQINLRRDLPAKEKLQRQLMLCGKLKLKLRRLYASQLELVKLRQTIQKCTVGVSIQPELNNLTPLEVYLLRYPDSLDLMMRILDEDNAKLKRLLEWKEKEYVFWEWMDSVLTLHIQESAGDDNVQGLLEEESVFLDIPQDISNQISSLRACVRDFILSHEQNIDRLEKLVSSKKIPHIELELVNHQIDKEINMLSQRFVQYNHGRFDVPPRNSIEDTSFVDKVNSASSVLMQNTQRKGQRFQRYVPLTAHSKKASKEAEVLEVVQVEISALQREVEVLEQELKQCQINSLKKMQSVTDQDVNSICILPRHCKQFLRTL